MAAPHYRPTGGLVHNPRPPTNIQTLLTAMDLRALSRGEVVIDLELGWPEVMRELANVEAIVDDLRHKRPRRDGSNDNRHLVSALVYNMAMQPPPHNYSEQMYQQLCQYVESYVARAVEPSLRQAAENGDYIAALDTNWKVYYVFVKWVRGFFSYLDRSYVKRQGLPSVTEVIVRPFRAAAISAVISQVAHENLALTRCLVHVTEFYMRLQYASVKIDPTSDITATMCRTFATLPLNTPADMDMQWVLNDTNTDAIVSFAASSKSIVATLPSSPPPETEARHLSMSSRMILNGLVKNNLVFDIGFLTSTLRPQRVPVIYNNFHAMRSAGTKYRAYQLLLLVTMMTRGADSEKPLVTVELRICEDLCVMIRDHLNAMPPFCIVDETFAWRLNDTTVKRPRLT